MKLKETKKEYFILECHGKDSIKTFSIHEADEGQLGELMFATKAENRTRLVAYRVLSGKRKFLKSVTTYEKFEDVVKRISSKFE